MTQVRAFWNLSLLSRFILLELAVILLERCASVFCNVELSPVIALSLLLFPPCTVKFVCALSSGLHEVLLIITFHEYGASSGQLR